MTDPAAIAALAVNAVFAAFGRAAIYRPPHGRPGAPVDCIVIRDRADRGVAHGDLRAVAPGNIVEVRAAEVTPERDGLFVIGGAETLKIQSAPRFNEDDPERLVYVCTVVAAQ